MHLPRNATTRHIDSTCNSAFLATFFCCNFWNGQWENNYHLNIKNNNHSLNNKDSQTSANSWKETSKIDGMHMGGRFSHFFALSDKYICRRQIKTWQPWSVSPHTVCVSITAGTACKTPGAQPQDDTWNSAKARILVGCLHPRRYRAGREPEEQRQTAAWASFPFSQLTAKSLCCTPWRT